jgi:hypothetical protein
MEQTDSINLKTIIVVLKRVLSRELTREAASNWAYKVRLGLESGQLHYLPNQKEAKIWHYIIVLEGIDLMDSPNSYLHNEQDIRLWIDDLDRDN